jgi:hypothetical protein
MDTARQIRGSNPALSANWFFRSHSLSFAIYRKNSHV